MSGFGVEHHNPAKNLESTLIVDQVALQVCTCMRSTLQDLGYPAGGEMSPLPSSSQLSNEALTPFGKLKNPLFHGRGL